MIAVIDYGMGNLKSVEKAAIHLGFDVKVTDNPETIKKAKKVIFPGVAHFGKAVVELRKRKLFSLIKNVIKDEVPFLGICLGMQLLFQKSDEADDVEGLAVIAGEVKKFYDKKLIVPHMGWNQIDIKDNDKLLVKGIEDKSFFYFVHSYYCVPENKDVILTQTNYGLDFCSAVHKDNVWAVQFHPEKSQDIGLKMFKNFLELC